MITRKNDWNKLPDDQISIEPFHTDLEIRESQDADKDKQRGRVMQPRTGDEVYAKVTKVEDRFAKVDIVAINQDPITAVFVGFI